MVYRKNLFLIFIMFSCFTSFSQIPKGATSNLLCNYKYDRSVGEWKMIKNCFNVNYEVSFLDKEVDVYDKITGVYKQIMTDKKTPTTIRKGYIYYTGLKDIVRDNSKVDILVSFENSEKEFIDFIYIEADFKVRIYLSDLYFYK